MIKMLLTASILTLLCAMPATAQQQRHYDAQGRSLGTTSTDSGGRSTYRDAQGRMLGSSTTDSGGTTTTRDAGGRIITRSSKGR